MPDAPRPDQAVPGAVPEPLPELLSESSSESLTGETPVDTTLFGFDYGTRRIGVAVGATRLGRARPLVVISNTNGTPDWVALDERVAEWQPSAFVIGWPIDIDGAEQALIAHVRGFARRLSKRYSRPVHAIDERYTSIAAGVEMQKLRASGQQTRRVSRGDVDTMAATLILEQWFARLSSTDEAPAIDPLAAR